MANYSSWELYYSSTSTSTFPALLIFTMIIITLLLFLRTLIRYIVPGSGRARKPPGPWRLPIIGNLHQLVCELPHRHLRDLARRQGPDVMRLQLGELAYVVLSSSEAAREVMKNHDVVFASRPWLLAADIVAYAGSDMVFTPYGEAYKHLRKICVVEVLGPARVRYFRPVREAAVAELVRRLSRKAAEQAVADVSNEVYQLTGRVACGTVLGKVREVEGGLMQIMENVSGLFMGCTVSELFPSLKFLPSVTGYKAKMEELHAEFEAMLNGIIDEHKERRAARAAASGVPEEEGGGDHEYSCKEDLVDVLLNLQESGDPQFKLTMENIKGVTMEIFLGGIESAMTTIDWTMAEMMKDQRVLLKAQEEVRQAYRGKQNVDESSLHELKYLDSIIKEGLRLHPALPLLLPRESRERAEICGYEIPAKTRVIINGWAIGRDPRHWTEPDRFYPERFLDSSIDYKGSDFEFIPFGAGRKMCPGLLYATVVVKLTLANLLYHFDWKLPDGMTAEDLDMTEVFGVVVRRKSRLCLIPVAYDALSCM